MPPDPLGILLISGSYERAHYAFMLAAGAGAIGRRVVLFATNGGTHALCRDWSALADITDAEVRSRGVAGLDELRDAAAELGTELMACDSGLRLAGRRPRRPASRGGRRRHPRLPVRTRQRPGDHALIPGAAAHSLRA